MTFLQKIGSLILKGVSLWLGFAPQLSQQLPSAGAIIQRVSKDLAEIARIVVDVEAVGQLNNMPGAEKAKAAGPLVANIIVQSSILAGQKIANVALFNQGCINIAGGVADVLNSLHEDSLNLHDASANHLPPA